MAGWLLRDDENFKLEVDVRTPLIFKSRYLPLFEAKRGKLTDIGKEIL